VKRGADRPNFSQPRTWGFCEPGKGKLAVFFSPPDAIAVEGIKPETLLPAATILLRELPPVKSNLRSPAMTRITANTLVLLFLHWFWLSFRFLLALCK
jgi:hypothetical protein